MRWHPATGLGAIVLANSTYAAAGALAGEMLAALVTERKQPAGGQLTRGPVPAPGGPWPETLAAQQAVSELLRHWDDAVAGRLFTPNVAQDRPLAQRREDIGRLRDRIGEFQPDQARPAEFESPAHCRWWLSGELGRAVVQIRLAPLREPRVQQLVLALPPAPGSVLDLAVTVLTATLNAGALEWPADLPATLSTAGTLRQLRLAAAWAGPVELTGCLAGDGNSTVTVELTGPDGRVALTVEVSGPGEQLRRAEVALLSA
jgi:hypothetical protein